MILFLISFGFYISKSQNLIRNGNFEQVNNPVNWSNAGGFFDYSASPTKRVVMEWDVFNSPDYFSANVTYTGTFRGVPVNDFGSSYPNSGNAYAGIGVYLNNPTLDVQEYIYQQLTSSLKQDSIYCLSFYISYSDRAKIAIKDIGASFSLTTPSLTSTGYINTIPQIYNTLGFLTDTINWTEIKGCFTAQGGENYITIGNFNSHANTDTLRTVTSNPFPTGGIDISYYYIDSVGLWQNNFPTAINEIDKESGFSIYPNPTKDILKIDFKNANEKRRIELYNAIGELVLSESLTTQNSSLKTHHLSSGVYFYTILVGEKNIKTDKIVIIK